MTRLSDAEIDEQLREGEWTREGDAIVREYELRDFAQAMAMANRVAAAAEEAGHHPDIVVHAYKHLRLTLSTHSEGGLTAADFALARTIDAL